MRAAILSVALLGLGAAAARADSIVHYGSAAAWVKPPLAGALPKQEGQPSYARLSEEDQTRFTRDGVERYHAHRIKVMTADGLSAAGGITEEWDPATQNLTINRLTIVRDGQTIDVLASEKFQVLRRERSLENDMLDGRLTAALQIADLRVGDIVDYAFTTTYSPKLLSGRHAETDGFLPGENVGATRIRALWDKAAPVQWRTGPGLPKPSVTETTDSGELLIEADNTVGPKSPAGAPARYGEAGTIQYSQMKDWRDVSALFFPLFDGAATLEPNSPLKAEAERIRRAAPTPQARAALALKLVEEEIRYVAIQMDAQGYLPAKADETWRRRFGDCKGKTALLIALLRELDIEAQPALVLSEDGDLVASLLPRVSAFDHVIARVAIGGRTYWLDGTRLGDGGLDTLSPPDFRWALPVAKAGAGLERIDQPPLDRPQFQSILRIDASAGFSQPAKVEATILRRGDEAISLARLLPTVAPGKAREYLLEEYGDWDWVEFKDAAWRWDASEGLMTMTLKGEGKVAVETIDDVPHIDLDDSGRFIPPHKTRPQEEDQTAPYAVPYPYFSRFVTILKLPGSEGLDVFGDPIDEEVAGFAQTRSVRMAGPYAMMTHTIRSVKPELSPDEMAKAAKALETVESDHAGVWPTPKPVRAKKVKLAALDGQGAWAYGAGRLDEDDYTGALAAFDVATRKGFTDPLLTINRAEALMGLKRHAEVAALLAAEDERLGAYRFRALFMRTAALNELSRAAEAEPFLDREIASSPSMWAHALRGEVRREGGDVAGAAAELQKAAALNAEDATTTLLLAAIWARLERWDEAVAAMQRVVRLRPEHARYWQDLADYQRRAGRDADALSTFGELMRMDPLDAGNVSDRAYLLVEMGRRDEATAELDAALASLPDNLDLLNSACWLRATHNLDPQKALAECEQGLKLSPNNGVLLDSRGFAKLRLGRNAEALADYEQAVKLEPKQTDSLYGRGLARIRTGATAAGQADLAAAEAADPGIGERWKSYALTQ